MAYQLGYFSETHDYWLGVDPDSKRQVLGIPVSNPMVDYIETYWLSDQQYATSSNTRIWLPSSLTLVGGVNTTTS